MIADRAFTRVAFAAVALIWAAEGAHAQGGQTPNALQGFQQNRDKPVSIQAQGLEVRDKEKIAIFRGNVHVVQGDTTIRCRSLVVTYEADSSGGGARAAQPGPGGRTQISKIEAQGNVIVTQKDQTATGENGMYDLRSNIVTLTGNVVVSQGGNIMRGERMTVDLNSGVSRVESGKSNAPVRMMIPQTDGPKTGAPAREIPRLDVLRPGQPN